MSKWKKAKERLLKYSKDYTLEELTEFLDSIGFEKLMDETNSEYCSFFDRFQKRIIIIPNVKHPGSDIIKQVVGSLIENGDM